MDLALRLMEQTRIFNALKGVRGKKPADLAALGQLLVRFSQLLVEQRWIKEIDINPLLVSGDGLIALDARVVVQGAEVSENQLPKLAIRPYPTQYVKPWKMKNGTEVTIRPIRPEDEPLMAKFHETLSERSVYLRYFYMIKLSQRIAHEKLTRICFIDYDREMALVADYKNPESGEHEVFGVGRLTKSGLDEAEFDILVSDKFQGSGLGTELLGSLVQIGRAEKLRRIIASILPENREMQRVSERVGFALHYSNEDRVVKAEIDL